MKACVLNKTGALEKSAFEVTTVPKPQPTENQILIRTHATALNPVDWKMVVYGFLIPKLPVVLGCDTAGVVEEVGSKVSHIKKGDRVCGFTELGKAGSFAEYCVMEANLAIQVPDNLSFEQASTLGVGGLTAALGLHKLGLPVPPSKATSSETILVWGGASSVGMFVIQFAHLIGLNVLATASPKNFDLLKKLGASQLFDYNSPDVVEKIKAATGGKLKYAFDCVGPKTADLCVSILDAEGSLAVIAGKPTSPPSTLKIGDVFLGGDVPAYHDFLVAFIKDFTSLLASNKVQPNPVHALEGGLEGIPDALIALQQGKASGQKIVVSWK